MFRFSLIRIMFLSVIFFFVNSAYADKAAPIQKQYSLDEVADNVFVVHGPTEVPNPTNQGFINNPSFIITNKGVVIIDPGSSIQVGEMLLSHITRTTSKPVLAIFNTHVHGDHWLGNQAIVAHYPSVKIYAHPMMAKMIKDGEDDIWIDFMLRLTEGATSGTSAVGPTHMINDGDEIKIGELTFQISHKGKAHTLTDIMIFVKELDVVYLGDNANHNFIVPIEGSFRGNIQALDDALASDAKVFIPGHGKTSGPEVAQSYHNFLTTIYNDSKIGYEEGKADFEIRPDLLPKLKKWQSWASFENQLGQLINFAYLEAEAADFE